MEWWNCGTMDRGDEEKFITSILRGRASSSPPSEGAPIRFSQRARRFTEKMGLLCVGSVLLSAHLLLFLNDSDHNPLTLLAIHRLYRKGKSRKTVSHKGTERTEDSRLPL